MRYENQNPQYISLMEKIEEQQKLINQLSNRCEKLNSDLRLSEESSEVKSTIINKLRKEIESYQDKYEELYEDAVMFNELPWFERLFHKFDV